MAKQPTAIKLPLPAPKRFLLAVVENTIGTEQQNYPSFVLSYVGMPESKVPDDEMLSDIQAVAANFTPHGKKNSELELIFFLQPQTDLLGFAHSRDICAEVNTVATNRMFQKIAELGHYLIVINTDRYTYKALVEDATGEVLEANVDYRLIN